MPVDLHALYSVPPADFVAARKALVAALKKQYAGIDGMQFRAADDCSRVMCRRITLYASLFRMK